MSFYEVGIVMIHTDDHNHHMLGSVLVLQEDLIYCQPPLSVTGVAFNQP